MIQTTEPQNVRGLEDVVAATTRLSRVDGIQGTLLIAGHWVEELAEHHRFEEVCHLLWHGTLPQPAASAELCAAIGRRRVAVAAHLSARNFIPLQDPMESLRSALADLESTGDPLEDAITAVAAAPVANARWWCRVRNGTTPTPRANLSTAADYLRMVTGEVPAPARVRALEKYLVTVSDHGLNASTFTARVIASTRSDLISALVGAVGALKGPLHGGAPGPVLDMLDAIGLPERAEAWLAAELDAGRRIMGMGHRVYRVRDPRAAVFENALGELARGTGPTPRLTLARAVERAAEALLARRHPERGLRANVEFYTAVLLEAVGLPRELFAPTFAIGRSAGWAGHVMEQRREDKLIRPRGQYTGPVPE